MTFLRGLRQDEPQPQPEHVQTVIMVDPVTKRETVVQVGSIVWKLMKEAGYTSKGKA